MLKRFTFAAAVFATLAGVGSAPAAARVLGACTSSYEDTITVKQSDRFQRDVFLDCINRR